MSGQIKVGDLVVVVKPSQCCNKAGAAMGRIFRVLAFKTDHQCSQCGDTTPGLYAMRDGRWRTDVRRLKRIPPLSELEGEKRDEKIEA